MQPRFLIAFLVLLFALMAPPAMADLATGPQEGPRAAPTTHVQVQGLPVLDTTPKFDPERATALYLAEVSGATRARSDAYFEGGYLLQGVDLIYSLAVAGLLLWLGISAALRDWIQERTPSRVLQVTLYAAAYVAIVTVATFPLSVYEGFLRERAYGLSNQDFLQWLGDFATAFVLTLIGAVILLSLLYLAIRKAGAAWWLWGAGLVIAFQIVAAVIYPVFIAPLFNHYAPLPDSPLKAQILSLARANEIPADNVWMVDASRQSKRISANVSGFLGTTRISLDDTLLQQATPDEVLAVMGHEMGHYVMGDTARLIVLMGLVVIAGFAFLHWGFLWATAFFGARWRVTGLDDIAGLPALAALAAIFFFLATPVTNSISRVTEYRADIFGLNAVRRPDAFATAMLKLAPYRKLDPGKWEEIIFYDHPSARTRIEAAMRWKKEHIRDTDIRDTQSPQ